MESTLKTKLKQRAKRKLRVRKSLRGTKSKPRMSVIRTNQNIYIQLIDDIEGRTLATTSTIAKGKKVKSNKQSAKDLGLAIAEQAKKLKIERAIFDRGMRRFHGIVAMVAEGAREGGLKL